MEGAERVGLVQPGGEEEVALGAPDSSLSPLRTFREDSQGSGLRFRGGR